MGCRKWRLLKKTSQYIQEKRKQKAQTNITILEILPFWNYNHQKERNLFNHITPQAGKIIANSINKDPKEKTNMERQPEEKKTKIRITKTTRHQT